MNPLLIRRRGMMTGKTLPYDAEIEYLQANNSSNAQTLEESTYIDTGYYPTPNTSLDIYFKFNNLTRQQRLCGCYGNLVFIVYITGGGYYGTSFADNINDAKTTSEFANTSKRRIRMIASSLKVYVDNSEITTRTIHPTNNADKSFKLFLATSNQIAMYGRIYYCKLTDGNTLVRDFIPVRVGTVGYMYDRVSGQLFGNAGTGSFVLGPDVQ